MTPLEEKIDARQISRDMIDQLCIRMRHATLRGEGQTTREDSIGECSPASETHTHAAPVPLMLTDGSEDDEREEPEGCAYPGTFGLELCIACFRIRAMLGVFDDELKQQY